MAWYNDIAPRCWPFSLTQERTSPKDWYGKRRESWTENKNIGEWENISDPSNKKQTHLWSSASMDPPCFQGRLHDYTPITMIPRTWCTKEMDPGHLGFLYLYSSFMFFCIPRFLYCVHALAKRLLIWLIFAHSSSFLVKQMTNLNRFIQFWGSTIAAAKWCTRFFHASSLTTLGPEPSGQKLSWSGIAANRARYSSEQQSEIP